MKAVGLYDLFDSAMANEMGVSIEEWIEVIENRCTLDEADFIISSLFEGADVDGAKRLFDSKRLDLSL